MAIPATATKITQKMDPYDRVDFQLDLAGKLLETGESIATYTLVMGAEGTALGVSISVATGYDPAIISGTSIKFWLEVDGSYQSDVAFTPGLTVPLVLSIVTDSSPARRRQRTFTAEITQL